MLKRMALGTVQLGQKYGIANLKGQPTRDEALALLDSAWALGVRTWDTAPAYGESEHIIGQWIRTRGKLPHISTKLPSISSRQAFTFDAASFADYVAIQARASRDKLAVEQLDVYLVHDEQDFMAYGEALLRALKQLQVEGVAKRVGLSVYDPVVAEQALAMGSVSALQVPCNLFDHRFHHVLEIAAEQGAMVFARSLFLQGLFFLTSAQVAERLPEALPYLEQIEQLGAKTGRDVAELALCYVRDRSEVDMLVVGVDSSGQLAKNLEYLEAPPLASWVEEEIERLFRDTPTTLVNPSLWR